MPRNRLRSIDENRSPWRASTMAPPVPAAPSSISMATAGQVPRPSTSSSCASPQAMATSASRGAPSTPKPTDATISRWRTQAATSASTASVACSMAPAVAEASSR